MPYEDKEYVSRRDGWRCTFCGRRVSRGTRHIDHSVSRANGGTNHLNNLRLACSPCNLKKGSLNARQFLGR
ncbi:MAG: HNH endonuclease [Terriglobia bacterium]